MKGLLFGFVFLISVIVVSGQCAIDYTYYPVVANYGLSPDSLPDGYVGQFYDEDMTFYLPLDTTDPSSGAFVTFEDFHITSISLPLGLTWECDNSASSCHYDPTLTQYGCVKLSGTALIPGNYNVQVDLVATHSMSSLVGPENISFILPLMILPDTSTSTNAGFAMSNPAGCAPITVSFTNNNIGMLSYFWDFGNGNTSNLAQPADQIYTQAGQYIVQYSADQTSPTYFLESIEVVTGSCTDIVAGDVDLFYDLSTSSGVFQALSMNNAVTQSFPLFINISNPLQLTGQNVTVEVWDDDSFWPVTSIEDCGALTFTPIQQAGIHSTNGGGLSINYTVTEWPANTVTSTDTIYVYDYPVVPNLVYDTLNNLIYTSGDSIAMQWYYYDSPIPGATDTFVEPESSGLYSLVVVNEYGCTAVSFDVLVVICDTTYQPILDNNGSTAWMLDSALYANLQWYDNNGIINGANQPFFPANGVGMYYIVATDTFGCSYSSESVFLGHTNLESIPFSGIVRVGPNPISNGFPLTIYIENAEFSDVTIILMDLYGREVIHRVVNSSLFPYRVNSQEISRLSNGLYYLDISFDGNKIRQKIIKAGAN
jgi:PKD repeat protein